MSEPWVLGIEIGGTKLQLGIGQGRGKITALERLSVDPSRAASGIRNQIQSGYATLLAQTGLGRADIKAGAVGFGGPVDTATGSTQKSFQVEGWDHFPLAAWLCDQLEIPVVVLENDSDCAGLAEARFGAGVGYSPLLYMNAGSGVGGALVIDEHIYRGSGRGALEIGHLNVPLRTDSGFDIVELEHAASGWAIASAARELARRRIRDGRPDWPPLLKADGNPDSITAALVAEAAREGDPETLAILDRARRAVACALVQAITLIAPRRVVVGGGVSLIGDELWFDPIRQLTDQDMFVPFRGTYDIVPAALGEEVVVQGALAVARDAISRPGSRP
jgi:glucokinase